MGKDPDDYLRRAMRLAGNMKVLADKGEAQAPDNGCAVLFGVIRDCAYRIQGRAEQEAESHRTMASWGEKRNNPSGEYLKQDREARW